MPAKLKYGEPTQMISIRVPQSRKEEIRELVRGVLNGTDGWVSIEDAFPEPMRNILFTNIDTKVIGNVYGFFTGTFFKSFSDARDNYPITHWQYEPQPPKSK
jgi:hypothetical protein